MNKAFITDYIDNPTIEKDILGNDLTIDFHPNIEVLLVWHEHIDKNYINKLPQLRGVVRYGVGYDSIDLDYTYSKKIYVCNTPDYGTDEVSDTAIAMIMNIARGISRYDYLSRNYKKSWQENTLANIKRNSDLKVGVIGAGRIGGSVILKANSLGFGTCFFDPYVSRGYEKLLSSERIDSLDHLLKQSDIVSINCPLTKETDGIVDEKFLLQMRDGASFVNTARGGLISDIDIFYEPLKSGKLSSVALDVLPHEPPCNSILINSWKNKEEWLDGRLIINPHTAYFSKQSYIEMRQKTALNAKRILDGQIPFNIVNGL